MTEDDPAGALPGRILATDKVVMRTEPIQQRSAERIALLLDAAAALIDEDGIDGVTTSAVAERSMSSVGVVYRYFPNIQTLLRALAVRNMERYVARVQQNIDTSPPEPWSSFDRTLDIFVEMNRTEPGFRALRFGDIIDQRFMSEEISNNSILARDFTARIGATYDFEPDDEILFHVEVAIEIGSALLSRAFQQDKDGDDRFIEMTRRVCTDYLTTHIPLPRNP
ncbi:TetR family transcriptional regulator [Microcella flavibacter]|uniref:TetR family transcriptional regulator n=1 Tax=Microcella flavibacter TaxID=1804990 RepID=UPI001456D140|nr:TetR family transcriptional regulator [Microcella flavibacter]